jgi:hypothetical protein
MKTILRIAAALSFLFFFVGGCCVLGATLGSPAHDAVVVGAVGCFFIGTAFFVGPMLLATAEKCDRKEARK